MNKALRHYFLLLTTLIPVIAAACVLYFNHSTIIQLNQLSSNIDQLIKALPQMEDYEKIFIHKEVYSVRFIYTGKNFAFDHREWQLQKALKNINSILEIKSLTSPQTRNFLNQLKQKTLAHQQRFLHITEAIQTINNSYQFRPARKARVKINKSTAPYNKKLFKQLIKVRNRVLHSPTPKNIKQLTNLKRKFKQSIKNLPITSNQKAHLQKQVEVIYKTTFKLAPLFKPIKPKVTKLHNELLKYSSQLHSDYLKPLQSLKQKAQQKNLYHSLILLVSVLLLLLASLVLFFILKP